MFKQSNILKYISIFVFLVSINLSADVSQGIELYKDLEYTKAKNVFLENESLKNPLSHFYLAEMYANGRGVKKDIKKAFKYYLSAAELGDVESQCKVAQMYRSGKGTDKNITQSDFWYLEVFKSMDEKWIWKAFQYIGHVGKEDEPLIKQIIIFLEDKAKNKNLLSQKSLVHIYYKNYYNVVDKEYAVRLMKEVLKQDDDGTILTRLSRYYSYKYEYEGKNNIDAVEAFKYTKQAASKGSSYSQHRLARIYEFGFGVDKDIKKAVHWYTKAANQDNNDAIKRLKLFYKKVKLSEKESLEYKEATKALENKNYQKAIKLYMVDANSDSPSSHRSQFNLGSLYTEGLGVSKNLKDAFKWYLMSANQGFGRAQNEIGDLYLYGVGVDKDRDKAVFWYRKASLSGHRNVRTRIGKFGDNDESILRDLRWNRKYKEAFKIRLYLAKHGGYYDDKHEIATMYLKGEGVEQNIKEAIYWYKEAFKTKKSGDLAFKIAELYNTGANNPKLAQQWYKKALRYRSHKYMRKSIYDYLTKRGVDTRNIKGTLQWLTNESQKNNVESLYILGFLYHYGEGIEQNYHESVPSDNAKALFYYEQAANEGHIESILTLARAYQDGWGLGLKKDKSIAFKLYGKAAKLNSIEGLYELAHMYKNGIGTSKNITKAKRIYEKLYKQNEEEATLVLAELYEDNKSIKKAITLYKEAFERFKSKSALHRLSHIYSYEDEENRLWCYEMLYSLGEKRYAYTIAEIYKSYFKNDKKMHYWYQKAIDADDLFATYRYDTICMINPQFNCLEPRLID